MNLCFENSNKAWVFSKIISTICCRFLPIRCFYIARLCYELRVACYELLIGNNPFLYFVPRNSQPVARNAEHEIGKARNCKFYIFLLS